MQTSQRQKIVQNKTLFISCVIPVFNEASLIGAFVVQLQQALQTMTHRFEIIVVDDGSHDETVNQILALPREKEIKLLGLSRNFGKEVALTAGIEHAKGDVVILLDADFQHPIELIDTFVKKWAEGYDMVYGARIHREAESYLKRNFARAFYWIMRKITQIDIPNNAGDFRLMDRKIVKALNFNEISGNIHFKTFS